MNRSLLYSYSDVKPFELLKYNKEIKMSIVILQLNENERHISFSCFIPAGRNLQFRSEHQIICNYLFTHYIVFQLNETGIISSNPSISS